MKPRKKLRLAVSKIKGAQLVLAKQELNQTNDKGKERKIITNKPEKIKISQIISIIQNNERE